MRALSYCKSGRVSQLLAGPNKKILNNIYHSTRASRYPKWKLALALKQDRKETGHERDRKGKRQNRNETGKEGDRTGRRQDRKKAGQKGGRTGKRQDRKEAGHERGRTGRRQDSKDSGQERESQAGHEKVGIKIAGKQDSRDSGGRTGSRQERKDSRRQDRRDEEAGKEIYKREGILE